MFFFIFSCFPSREKKEKITVILYSLLFNIITLNLITGLLFKEHSAKGLCCKIWEWRAVWKMYKWCYIRKYLKYSSEAVPFFIIEVMRTFGWSPTEGELRVCIGFLYNFLLLIIFYKNWYYNPTLWDWIFRHFYRNSTA